MCLSPPRNLLCKFRRNTGTHKIANFMGVSLEPYRCLRSQNLVCIIIVKCAYPLAHSLCSYARIRSTSALPRRRSRPRSRWSHGLFVVSLSLRYSHAPFSRTRERSHDYVTLAPCGCIKNFEIKNT